LRLRRGLILLLLLVVPWLAAITWKSGGAFWSEAVGRDLLGKVAEGQESHGFPPGYYSITYSLFLWPVGYLALLAGLNAVNRARLDPRLLFLLAWYVPLWIVLELVPTKLPHYMLPAYPAAAIALGWFLTDPNSRAIPLAVWQKWLAWLGLFGLALVTLALIALPPVLTFYFGGTAWVAAGLASVAALAAGLSASPLGERVPPMLRIPGMALLAGAFLGLTTGIVLPGLDPVWVSREIARIYEAGKPCPDSELTLVGYEEPSVVFLTASDTRFAGTDAAAAKLEDDRKCAVVVVTSPHTDAFLAAAAERKVAVRSIGSISGLDYSNGDHVEARLFVAK
jgi:4-amino-4-deoxy-L-arabinose transferase-like glycosyltransferase